MGKGFLVILLLAGLIFLAAIYFGQTKMIYFPRGYSTYGEIRNLVDYITYESDGAGQTSFIFPKGTSFDQPPQKVWWLFGGNGSTALDWVAILDRAQSIPKGHVFILVDYPGYGECGGKPSPKSIHDSINQLHRVLGDKWNLDSTELSNRSAAMGHSLGAAVALHTAAKYDMQQCVAISPFTTMTDMAKLRIGLLHPLLRHHYDNRASIESICSPSETAAAAPETRVMIYHGSNDRMIPIRMAQELAEIGGKDLCRFFPVDGHGHNDILYAIQNELLKILTE